MDANIMKRMIVLKDLQSNMVEEAYIVFKNNVKLHKAKKIDKEKISNELKKKNNKDYMIKEAELVVNDYISKLEGRDYRIYNILRSDYIRLRIITISLCIYSLLNFILLILK